MTTSYVLSRFDASAASLGGGDPNRVLTDYCPDVIVLVQPDARCRHVTPASQWVLGRPPAELIGTDLRDIALPSDRDALDQCLVRLGNGELSATAEFRAQYADAAVWLEVNGRRLPAGAGAVMTLRDITARKEGEAVLEEANSLLRRRAATDLVTGLLSRDHFVATLERESRRAQRDRTDLAVLVFGIPAFRLFTDLYGWEASDTALREVAEAAGSALHRPGDVAGRLDADEFALLLPATDASGAAALGQRVTLAVAERAIPHAGSPSSILEVVSGLALSCPGHDMAELLRAAHRAMRAAKGEPLAAPLPAY